MTKRQKIDLPGTAFQKEQRQKSIERRLRQHARGLRGQAAYLENLATRMEVRRLENKPPDTDLLLRAIDQGNGCANHYISKLFGIRSFLNSDGLRDWILEKEYPSAPEPSSRAMANDPVPLEPEPRPAMREALAEALSIVRSASVEEIDWTKEPISSRERAVRAKIIENIVHDYPQPIWELMRLVDFRNDRAASDLRAAIDQADARIKASSNARVREHLDRAIRDVDGVHDAKDGEL